MDLKKLIAEARRRSDDTEVPPFVSDEAYAPLASEAEREACIRARLLFDDSTADVTQYAITAGSGLITLHESVDIITAAEFQPAAGGRRRELDLTGMDWIRGQCDWSTRTSSRPGYLAHISSHQARLWPTPSVAGTLYLSVYRLPLFELEALEDEPEIAAEEHAGLVDWMLYRVYTNKDGEQFDPARADAALAAFEERFGERNSADVRRRHRERRRVTTGCL